MSNVQAQTPEKKLISLRLTTSTFCATIPFAMRSGLQTPVECFVLCTFHCMRRSVVPVVVGAGAGAGGGAGGGRALRVGPRRPPPAVSHDQAGPQRRVRRARRVELAEVSVGRAADV